MQSMQTAPQQPQQPTQQGQGQSASQAPLMQQGPTTPSGMATTQNAPMQHRPQATSPLWGPQQQQAFSAPIPGQSWTHPLGSMPYQHPPQFVNLNDAMNFLVDQLIDVRHLKELLFLFKQGISIEEVARTILFTGFANGKWTVDLTMLMFRPLMATLIAIAHRAGLKDTALFMKHRFDKNDLDKVQMVAEDLTNRSPPATPTNPGVGFVKRT